VETATRSPAALRQLCKSGASAHSGELRPHGVAPAGAHVLHVQRVGNLPQLFWRLSLFREDVYETAADAGRIF